MVFLKLSNLSEKIISFRGVFLTFPIDTAIQGNRLPSTFICTLVQGDKHVLKFLEYGLSIDVVTTQFESIGIDTAEDLARARDHFKQSLAKPC